jgi:2-keto-4-pentenoate hydratase/2-oxohepta-3-ene-1,7-dioic acid hydratase in catechol pathway
MKLACFSRDGGPQLGLVDEAVAALHPIDAPTRDMVELIETFDTLAASLKPQGEGLPLAAVRLLAPIPAPRRNIFCVGKNYREHAKEFAGSGYEAGAVIGAEIDAFPAVFTKPGSAVVGPGATVELHPHVTSAVDYEAELALVISKAGRDISPDRAYDHIWGYTIVNDVTARTLQQKHRQWVLGKGIDGFCPMGPAILTADEVPDPTRLRLRTWVNGELRQDASVADLIFDISTLIETISAGITLEPGDVIATGTPVGVGLGFSPPKFLKAGDTVRIEVGGIGTLENPVA